GRASPRCGEGDGCRRDGPREARERARGSIRSRTSRRSRGSQVHLRDNRLCLMEDGLRTPLDAPNAKCLPEAGCLRLNAFPMVDTLKALLDEELNKIRAAGLYKDERVIQGPQGPHIQVSQR